MRQDIMRTRSVWGRLGKLLRRKGTDTKATESFYRAAVQAILLYGLEKWVVLESMTKMTERTHTDFLKMITGKIAKRLGYGTWETPGE